MRKHTPLFLILLVYLVVGSLYAVYTPAWQAPDEPAHYNYVRQLAGGHLPVMEPDDYDEAYRSEVVSSGFAERYSIAPLTYEDWQPPLYYLLLTPVFLLFDGTLLPLRLVSVLLGAAVVGLAYGVARRVWPGRGWLALTATAFVAFLPQHVAMLASVNNDSLAEVWIGVILWILVASGGWRVAGGESTNPHSTLHIPHSTLLVLGVVLGLGFLTKATVYLLAPVVGVVLVWRYWGAWRALGRAGVMVFAPAGVLGALWWVRNLVVYPGLDVMGTAAHDAAVAGQARTADWLAQFGTVETARRFVQTTFQSFWGQFGWMGVPMPPWVYQILLLFSALVLAGLLWTLLKPTNNPTNQQSNQPTTTILTLTFLLTLLLYLGYNVTFVQHQGRYLFPALIPIGVGVALGVGAWARPVVARWRWTRWLVPAGVALGLVGLDLLALFRFIVPTLA